MFFTITEVLQNVSVRFIILNYHKYHFDFVVIVTSLCDDTCVSLDGSDLQHKGMSCENENYTSERV